MKKKILFPKKKQIGKRPWGKEELLVLIPKILTLKKLTIKKGSAGGLQYHRKKDEAAYIISGKLLVTYANEKGVLIKKELNEGSWLHFPNGAIHQETALTDVELLEVSTPHFNDRVRVEEEFGLDPARFSGLPSTEENEIITK